MEENNLIFGIRAVMEALKAGKEIDKILIKKTCKASWRKSCLPL